MQTDNELILDGSIFMQLSVTAFDNRAMHLLICVGWKRLLFAVCVSFVLSTQLMFQENVLEHYSIVESLESLLTYFLDIAIIAVLMAAGVAAADARIPKSGPIRNATLLAAVLVSVVAGVALQMGIHYGSGPYPPDTYVLGETARWILIGGAIVLIYETIRRHHRHQAQLHAAELRHKVLGNQMIESRIKMMEAQIEPHFLFNTLATVKRLYRTEPVSGAHMVSRLKEYLQAALPQIRHGIPTLASELELVRAYLEILRIRMGSRLEFSIQAPVQTLAAPFPAMVLITLVENAIKHGLNPLPHGGRIDIDVSELPDDGVAIEVRDNGVGFQVGAGTSGTGIGLANIRLRLMALYGDGASMSLQQGSPAGVVARVEIVSRNTGELASHYSPVTASKNQLAASSDEHEAS